MLLAPDAEAPSGRVALAGAARQTVTFTLHISEMPSGIARLELVASPLDSPMGAIPPSAIRAYRMHRVRAPSWPGWHIKTVLPAHRERYPPDVLVPVDAPVGGLRDLQRQERGMDLWVEIDIPAQTPAGLYTGRLSVAAGAQAAGFMEIDLVVHPFELPHDGGVELLADVDFQNWVLPTGNDRSPRPQTASPEADAGVGMAGGPGLEAALRMLEEHGLTPVLTGVYPMVKLDVQRRVRIDWDDYDRLVAPWVDGFGFADGRPAAVWPIPFDETFPPRPASGSAPSAAFLDMSRQYLKACADHFAQRGWLERSFVALEGDDPTDAAGVERFELLSGLCRRADDRLEIASMMYPQDPAAVGATTARTGDPRTWSVDVWMPKAQFFDPTAMHGEREQGRRAWMRLDRPPFSGTLLIGARPADARVIPWQARRLNTPVVILGSAASWPAPPAEQDPTSVAAFDASNLIYPGEPFGLAEPVPSVRLKELRRGQQDMAYLRLLEERGLSHIAEAMIASLVHHAGAEVYGAHFADGRPPGWPQDPALWDAAVRVMTDELLRQAGLGGVDPMIADIQWRRFMEAARSIDVQAEGVRVRSAASASTGGLELECLVRVENHRRTPIEGSLALEGLPAAWTAGPPREIGPLPPGQTQQVSLTAHGAAAPALVDGCCPLPIWLQRDGAAAVSTAARFAMVSASRLSAPITLDGQLTDWPVAAENAAGDFLLVSAQGQACAERDAADRPRHRTLAFVTRDDAALYVALRCQVGPAQAAVVRGNALSYDDLIPRGADLVELLFDTVCDGSRAPSDLYHIVLMRSGGHVAERGVQLGVACGTSRPWPVDLRWQMKEAGGFWIAEVRIPLTDLGIAAREPTVIGFNITRLDAGEEEFSTWSGAHGNAYDPAKLGNLLLP